MEVLTGSRGDSCQEDQGSSEWSEDGIESFASSFGDGFDLNFAPEDKMDVGFDCRRKLMLDSNLPPFGDRNVTTDLSSSYHDLKDLEIEIVTPRPAVRSPQVVPLQRLGRSSPGKTAELSPIPEPKQFKRWKNATPSKFCHFCGRLPKSERVVCKNINQGTCRKVFCRPCMEKIFGDWDASKSSSPTWECTHCAGACPTKASCRYYSKTNSKRFLKGQHVQSS